MEGGCACGAVRYRVTAEPIMTFQCHCVDCQKASGGPFVAAALFERKAFSLTKGRPKLYATPSSSGGTHVRGFCENCGSRLTGGEKETPGPWIGVTVSSFDDASWFRPQMHFFVAHAQPWDRINDDLPKHRHYPPQAEASRK